jgi:histidyl-tRNA synthetase
VEVEQAGRSAKGQLKHAARLGARLVVKLSGDGISVRDMRSGEEKQVAGEEEAVAVVNDWL